MFTDRVEYEDHIIKEFLGNKMFLLEAIVGHRLPDKDIGELYSQVSRGRISARQKGTVELLRTHDPTKIVKFIGMEYGQADWWAASIEMVSNKRSSLPSCMYMIVVGWSNSYGTEAKVVSQSLSERGAIDAVVSRATEKEEKGYEVEVTYEDLMLVDEEIEKPQVQEAKKADDIPDWLKGDFSVKLNPEDK